MLFSLSGVYGEQDPCDTNGTQTWLNSRILDFLLGVPFPALQLVAQFTHLRQLPPEAAAREYER